MSAPRFAVIELWLSFAMLLLINRASCDDRVFLWNLHTPDFGSFKVVIEKDRLSQAKRVDLMKENPPLSLKDAARIAMNWAKGVHGDIPGMRVDDVVFIAGGDDGEVGFSYYRVTVVIPDYLPGGGGARKTVWERVPVMFDGKVLDRVPVKDSEE